MNTYKFSKEDTLCVKAAAIILMLFHHLFAFPDKLTAGATLNSLYTLSDGKTLEYILGDFGKLCVALFMMLSGYGIYLSYRNNSSDISKTIIKRIKNAYIKYWQIFIIFIPLGAIIGAKNISPLFSDWVKNFFAIDTTFNNEWWFMTIYLMILCFFPLIIKWVDRKNANPWTDMIILIAFSAFAHTALPSFFSTNKYMSSFNGTYFFQKLSVVLAMLPMFTAGCYMAHYDIPAKIRNRIPHAFIAKLLGAAIIIITFILRQKWTMRTPWGWDRIDFIYACTFCIGFAFLVDGFKYVKKALAFVGSQATGMWLIHTFFCYYYFQNFIYAPKNPILVFLLLFTISLVLSWGIGKLYSIIGNYLRPLFLKSE